jgi:lysozyme family protein
MKFDTAVKHVLAYEGGLVDNPKDPGGITKFGISYRSYPEYGVDGIKALTKQQAMDIYLEDYWDAVNCSELPDSLRLMVFDCAVNQGVYFAVTALQSAVSVKADGIFGNDTRRAVRETSEEVALRKLALNRYYRYARNPNWDVFGDGWMSRLLSVSLITGG